MQLSKTTGDVQAVDEQVDQLATAAGKAIGSLWSGIGSAFHTGFSAASSMAGQLENAANTAATRIADASRESSPWYAFSRLEADCFAASPLYRLDYLCNGG
jgi:hypothetical protein